MLRTWFLLTCLSFSVSVACRAQSGPVAEPGAGAIAGQVLFPDGTVVPEAAVKLRAAAGGSAPPEATTADRQGAFRFTALPPGLYQVEIESAGQVSGQAAARVEAGRETRIDVVASLAGPRESVTVTATLDPRPAGSVPSAVTVLDGERVRNAPSITLDEALRAVPGFSLFRRTSSLAAHPTAQGVSLRGVGPSGASRSLVLADGIPINDPFGGWVYWNRVPREAIASVEVMRGAASSIYGDSALSGVASIRSERPQRGTARASIAGGNTGLVNGSWLLGTRTADQRWGLAFDGEAFRNDGYFAIAEHDRGAIDRPVALQFATGRLRGDRQWHTGSAFATFGLLTEDRDNGTSLQFNSTDLRYGSAGFERRTAAAGAWRGSVFTQSETFRSTFTRITADRNQEFLTLHQRVPSVSAGGRLEWSKPFARHHLAAGSELRWVDGDSHERNPAGVLNVVGGRQWTSGVFVQDVFSPAVRWQLTASARLDRWETTDGRTGASQSATVVNPQLGVRFQAAGALALRAQAYRGFRAPTLNELYRQFRVGNVLTLANAGLRPERTNGAEAGADLQFAQSLFRLTGFWTDLRDPVSNVTLSTGATITRQRRNVGRATIRGLEADWEWRPGGALELRASYLFDDATVARFAPDPLLEGLWLPQVPRHRGVLALQWLTPRRGLLRVETRLSGIQYDDDRNQLALAGFAETGVAFVIPAGRHWEWFVRAENIFDRRYPVARTPVVGLSAPRMAQVGIRFRTTPAR